MTSPAQYRAPTMRVEAGFGPGYFLAEPRAPGSQLGKRRVYALVDVGYVNPLYAHVRCGIDDADVGAPDKPYSSQCPPEPGSDRIRKNRSWQVSLPVAFHLFWDPFSSNAPIVNTDYEFGLDVSRRWALASDWEARAGGYVGHISTHIGDEYTIAARENPANPPFPRVNVSYEPWRLSGSARGYGPDQDNLAGYRSFVEIGFELEGSCVPGTCGDQAYYRVFPGEDDGATVPATQDGLEGQLMFSAKKYRPLTAGEASRASLVPASVDAGLLVGWRRVFPYVPNEGPDDELAPVVNAVLGYTFHRPQHHSLPVMVYVRGYYGPNPYGQLRSQREFWLVSMGFQLAR